MSVTFSTSKSLNKINISLSFAKYSFTAAEIINQILQKGLGPRPHKSLINLSSNLKVTKK